MRAVHPVNEWEDNFVGIYLYYEMISIRILPLFVSANESSAPGRPTNGSREWSAVRLRCLPQLQMFVL